MIVLCKYRFRSLMYHPSDLKAFGPFAILFGILILSLCISTPLEACSIAHGSGGSTQQQADQIVIGVLDLEYHDVTEGESRIISDRLRTFLGQQGVFKVIERQIIINIMRELGFQTSGACNTAECVAQLGEIIGANKMVAGLISKFGAGYSVNVRIIDIESTQIEHEAYRDIDEDIAHVRDVSIREIAEELAQKVKLQLRMAPLNAPSELSAITVGHFQIDLSWIDNSNESGFLIERKTGLGGTYLQIGTVGANVTSYSDTELTDATEYYYRIRAYNQFINSGYSDEVNSTTLPGIPSQLIAGTVSYNRIMLAWTDNSSTETGFRIERKTGPGGAWSVVGTLSEDITNFNDGGGLTEVTTYYYRVRSIYPFGDSYSSSEASATTLLAPPGGITTTASDSTQIFLSWTDRSNSEVGYRIERKRGLIGTFTQIGQVGANITSYRDAGLSMATTYHYRVYAFDHSGESHYSNEVSARTLSGLPPVPLGVSASTVLATQIDLSWTDVSAVEIGYLIERMTGADGMFVEIGQVERDITRFSDTGLDEAKTYYYRIRAHNQSGYSGYSEEVSATTRYGVPAKPTVLSAPLVSFSVAELTWTDTAEGETGFRIERRLGDTRSWVEVSKVGEDVTRYTDTGLRESTTYFYRVRAYNQSGNSEYSEELRVVTRARATITVNSIPVGATVLVDSMRIGVTPITHMVGDGSHSMVVNYEGYESQTNQFTISPGEWRDFSFMLLRAGSAQVTFLNTLSGARLHISGDDEKITVLNQTQQAITIRPGNYSLEVRARGYRPWRKDIELNDKDTITLPVGLREKHRLSAGLLSLVLPGVGQFYEGRPLMGSLFTLVTAGSAFYAWDNYKCYSDSEDDYNSLLRAFESAETIEEITDLQNQLYAKFIQMKHSKDDLETSVSILAAIWLVNTVDSVLFMPRLPKIASVITPSISTVLTNRGVAICFLLRVGF